jgi:hypothetical protein
LTFVSTAGRPKRKVSGTSVEDMSGRMVDIVEGLGVPSFPNVPKGGD